MYPYTHNISKVNSVYWIMLSSFIVSVEPSPFDLFMLVFIIYCILFNLLEITTKTWPPIMIIGLFILSNLISLLFADSISVSIQYVAITIYLIVMWYCLLILGHKVNSVLIELILKGYLVAGLLATVIGVLAYFHLVPLSDLFLMFGRVKSTFKDPNVFGPYLVIPALYSYMKFEEQISFRKRVIYLICFVILIMGIVLSFSRAAWGNFGLSFLIFILFIKKHEVKKRIKSLLLIIILATPFLFYFVQTPEVENLLSTRLAIKEYDSDRFNTQKLAFELGLTKPFGIGPGQSEIHFNYSPHSLYARVFTENGLLGLAFFISFLLLSLFKVFKASIRQDSPSSTYAIITACLVGLLFNSLFIDTLHWRHFWIVLAMAWVPYMTMHNLNGQGELK